MDRTSMVSRQAIQEQQTDDTGEPEGSNNKKSNEQDDWEKKRCLF